MGLVSKECLNCGTVFESQESAGRKYCCSACQQEKRTKDSVVLTTCNCCGKEYFSKRWEHERYLRGDKKYECCSPLCSNRIIASNNFGENNGKYNSISVVCQNCGDTYLIPKSRENNSRFCSRKCLAESKTKKATIVLSCQYCSEKFSVLKGELDFFGDLKYCSKECRGLASRKRVDLVCTICGKEYQVVKSYSIKSVACSDECRFIWLKEYSNNPDVIKRLRRQGAKSHSLSKSKNTLPEKIVKKYLKEKKIENMPQYPVEFFVCDFYIPEFNAILEVYGDYWHGNPKKYGKNKRSLNDMQKRNKKKDRRRKKFLTKSGYLFYFLWEDDIKKDINKSMNKFFKYINSKIRNESVV